MSKVRWKDVALKEACDIVSGGTPSRNEGSYWNGNIPWVTPTDITSNKSKFLYNTSEKISINGLNSSAARMLPKGTILLTSRASLGFAAIAGLEVTTNQGFKSLICREDYDNEYIYYYVDHSLRSQMQALACGSTFLEISKKDMERLNVLIPEEKKYQRKISRILSCIDACIDQTKDTITKLQKVKAGLMQDLFTRGIDSDGKLRPAFEDKPELYKPSRLGMIPKEWDCEMLRDVCVIEYGKSPIGVTIASSEISVVGTSGHLGYSNKKLFNGPFVLVGRKGTIDKPLYITDNAWVIDTAYALFAKDKINLKYIFYFLNTIDLLKYNEASGVPSLNREVLYKIAFPKVSLTEQNSIVQKLEQIDQLIESELIFLKKNGDIKHGLMQDLLTGKVEVKVDKDE